MLVSLVQPYQSSDDGNDYDSVDNDYDDDDTINETCSNFSW